MNVYKFVILWLVTIPIIFSATFLNVPEINTIETQLIEPYDIFGQEAFFKIKFSNNAVSGYTINVKSANGSQFNHVEWQKSSINDVEHNYGVIKGDFLCLPIPIEIWGEERFVV